MSKPLTKSLHTVSAAVNVAAHIYVTRSNADERTLTATELADAALMVLGQYDDTRSEATDATVGMIVKQIRKTGMGA